MDRITKLLQKIPQKDRDLLERALQKLWKGDFKGLERKKLKGSQSIYRIRVGQYRIIYFDDGSQIILKAIKRRNEHTYRDW